MAWTTLNFYKNSFLHGDTPLIPDASFLRWESRAVETINTKRINFADAHHYAMLMKAVDFIKTLAKAQINIESDNADDIADFINAAFEVNVISAFADIDENGGIYTLTLKMGELSAVFEFETDDGGAVGEFYIKNLTLMPITANIAPVYMQNCVCAVAEILYSQFNAPKAGQIISETNDNYSWRVAEAKKDMEVKNEIRAAISKYLENTPHKYLVERILR